MLVHEKNRNVHVQIFPRFFTPGTDGRIAVKFSVWLETNYLGVLPKSRAGYICACECRGSCGNAEAGTKPKIAIVQKPCYIEAYLPAALWSFRWSHQCMLTTKQKQVFQFHKAGESVSVVYFPLFAYTWKVELFSRYAIVSDVLPWVICLTYIMVTFFNFSFQRFAPHIYSDAVWYADFKYRISFFSKFEKSLP